MANPILHNQLHTALNKLAAFWHPRGSIAMFHYGRCGSTVLGDLLAQHPEIFWDSEVFERVSGKQRWKRRFIKDPIVLLRARTLLVLLAQKKYYGFETKCHRAYHLRQAILNTTPSSYIAVLKQLGYKYFIVLKRRNYLRQKVSEEVGKQKGRIWHQPAGAKASLHPIILDPNQVRFGCYRVPLLKRFEEFDKSYHELEQLLNGDRTLWLTYEDDILPDPKLGYRRVCEFIGVSPHDAAIKRSRTNPFSLRDILENFDEVETELRGTPYEWMLYD